MHNSKNLKTELLHNIAIPLLGIHPKKKPQTHTNSEKCMNPTVHSSIIYNSQDMEGTWAFTKRWMDREDMAPTHIHTHTHTHTWILAIKKFNSAICNNMDWPRRYHA